MSATKAERAVIDAAKRFVVACAADKHAYSEDMSYASSMRIARAEAVLAEAVAELMPPKQPKATTRGHK